MATSGPVLPTWLRYHSKIKAPAKAGQAGDNSVRDLEQTPAETGAFQPGGNPGKPLLAKGLHREPEFGAASSQWGQAQLCFPCSQPAAGTGWWDLDTEGIKNPSGCPERCAEGSEGPGRSSLRPGREPLSPLAVSFLSRVTAMAPSPAWMLPAELPPPPSSVHTSGCSSKHQATCAAPLAGLPTIDSDVEVELRVGGLDEALQGLGGVAALASQDIHHSPHLLGQGARCLHLGSLLGRQELQPAQVPDDVLQELWGDGPRQLPAVPLDPGPCGTAQRDRWVLEQPRECEG